MLLRAVVDVALEAAPLGILRGDDALPRCAQIGCLRRDLLQARLQVGGEPDVSQDLSGLSGEVSKQFLLNRGDRLARTFLDGQRPQFLTLVSDGRCPVGPFRRNRLSLGGPGRGGYPLAVAADPDAGRCRAHAFAKDAGEAG